MNTQLKITLIGILVGVGFVALASSGACNKSTSVDCATSGSSCQATSPNCDTGSYSGTVTSAGSKTAITGGSPGYTSWDDGDACSYVCTITKDCDNLSPQVNKTGDKN